MADTLPRRAAVAVEAIREFAGDDLTQNEARALLAYWVDRRGLTDGEREAAIGQFRDTSVHVDRGGWLSGPCIDEASL